MNFDEVRNQMQKSIDSLTESWKGIHTGNVSVGLISSVKIPCYGQQTPLEYLSIIAVDGNRISVTPYDGSLIKVIESTLQKSGFNASLFSKKEIVVSVPKITSEQKMKTIAHVKKLSEDAKIAIRNIRRNMRDKLTATERKEKDREIQVITDEFVAKIDELAITKTREIA